MDSEAILSKMTGVYTLGQFVFQTVTLADDLCDAVKVLKKRKLIALSHFAKSQKHHKAVVGLVISVAELEMSRRWFAEHSGFEEAGNVGLDIDDLPAGGTAAEGMDRAMRVNIND